MLSIRELLKDFVCSNCEMIDKLLDSNGRLNDQIKILNEKLEFFESIQNFHGYRETILKIVLQKKTPILITVQTELDYKGKVKDINFYAYENKLNSRLERVQTLFAHVSYNEYDIPERVSILDFRGITNHGYGSIVMGEFLEYIKTIGLKSIKDVVGHLSFVDKDHWDMLYHFYGKFGFKITEDKRIVLKLDYKQ